jgi:hypothetical protein
MPQNGVAGFQSNFYLTPILENLIAELSKCPDHPQEELDVYCIECKVVSCHKYARTKHTEERRNHPMENIPDAARKALEQLKTDKKRVEGVVSDLKAAVAATEKEKLASQTHQQQTRPHRSCRCAGSR